MLYYYLSIKYICKKLHISYNKNFFGIISIELIYIIVYSNIFWQHKYKENETSD